LGGAFFSVAGVPPDPAMVGPDWKERWLKRLEILQPFPALWLEHQRRDAFWQHGSVCEDYGKLGCAILAVGGWADGYTAAVFRLVENMKRPDVKGIAGPWGHLYPQRGIPGPAIGFLQECKRWWDRWLKGERNGVENDPALRLWLQDYVPPRRTTTIAPVAGSPSMAGPTAPSRAPPGRSTPTVWRRRPAPRPRSRSARPRPTASPTANGAPTPRQGGPRTAPRSAHRRCRLAGVRLRPPRQRDGPGR
jgi:hypothetical protein